MNMNNRYLFFVCIVVAMGGLLFGFDTAVISGTIPFIRKYFNLNDIELGWAVGSLLIGCMFGVAISGKPADHLGRRKTLLISAFLFLFSTFGSALSTTIISFISFRFVGGIAVGTASLLSPMYISEISPAEKRGSMVSLNQLAIVTGILVAFFSNYFLVGTGENNWRLMLCALGIPSIVFFVSLLFVPESPRWLLQKGKREEALNILGRIVGSERASAEILTIEESLVTETKASLKEVFSKKMRPILGIGIFVAVFQQITGINSIMYYAPMIFAKTGIGIGKAYMQTVAVGAGNLIFTFLAMKLIDRVGRKPLLIAGNIGMLLSLLSLSITFFMEKTGGYLVLASVLVYIASFSLSIGPVTWVLISEIYPNRLRSEAMSVVVVILWAACFLVSLTFPYMLNVLGGGSPFLIFGTMCAIYLIFIILKVPETKNKSLEELEKILFKNNILN